MRLSSKNKFSNSYFLLIRSCSLLFTFFFLLIIFLIWTVPFSFSQAHLGKGRISGIVVDEQGNPIEGVLITVESLKYKRTILTKRDTLP